MSKKKYILESFDFKNVDKIFINMSKKKIKDISNILNNKFLSNIKIKIKAKYIISLLYEKLVNILHKKIIFLYFEDNHDYAINFIIKILKNKYKIKISNKNPDYLIYNVFGCNHTKLIYNNSIKIAIFTENQIPDFNIADYAISNSHINYLDRHLNNPYYLINILKLVNNYNFKIIRNKVIKSQKKNKFCAAVISNFWHTDNVRLDFINELNKYKIVDMGGQYKNNVGYISNKIKFLFSYKFSIAMENTEGDGYVSEKIIESFLAGTIPIYYGSYMIDEFINLNSFILIKGKEDMNKKIEYIKNIDNNYNLFQYILSQNVLIDEKVWKKSKNEFQEFLFNIFEQDKKKAKRISTNSIYNCINFTFN